MSATFENPLMVHVCDSLGIEDVPELMILEYQNGKCHVILYDMKKDSKISPVKKTRVHLDDVVSLFNDFMGQGNMAYPDSVGTDRKSIYDSLTHREVKYLRAFFPTCLLQVDYEDESQNLDFSYTATDLIRESFKVIEPEGLTN